MLLTSSGFLVQAAESVQPGAGAQPTLRVVDAAQNVLISNTTVIYSDKKTVTEVLDAYDRWSLSRMGPYLSLGEAATSRIRWSVHEAQVLQSISQQSSPASSDSQHLNVLQARLLSPDRFALLLADGRVALISYLPRRSFPGPSSAANADDVDDDEVEQQGDAKPVLDVQVVPFSGRCNALLSLVPQFPDCLVGLVQPPKRKPSGDGKTQSTAAPSQPLLLEAVLLSDATMEVDGEEGGARTLKALSVKLASPSTDSLSKLLATAAASNRAFTLTQLGESYAVPSASGEQEEEEGGNDASGAAFVVASQVHLAAPSERHLAFFHFQLQLGGATPELSVSTAVPTISSPVIIPGPLTDAAVINSRLWVVTGSSTSSGANRKDKKSGGAEGQSPTLKTEKGYVVVVSLSGIASPNPAEGGKKKKSLKGLKSQKQEQQQGTFGATATLFETTDVYKACRYDLHQEGLRWVAAQTRTFSSEKGDAKTESVLVTSLLPFPDRESIVEDTVAVTVTKEGLEDLPWAVLAGQQQALRQHQQQPSDQRSVIETEAIDGERGGSGSGSVSPSSLLAYCYPMETPGATATGSESDAAATTPDLTLRTVAPYGLQVVRVETTYNNHTRRRKEGKSVILALVAEAGGKSTSADKKQSVVVNSMNVLLAYNWHPSAVRSTLRLCGSQCALAILQKITQTLAAQGKQSATATPSSDSGFGTPLHVRSFGLQVAQHIVTLQKQLGLSIPEKDLAILYEANAANRSAGPHFAPLASRTAALSASQSGNLAQPRQSFQTYSNEIALGIAHLKQSLALPAEFRSAPTRVTFRPSSTVSADYYLDDAFLEYERSALRSN